MRLFFVGTVRRFVGLFVLLFCAIPFGLSVVGCGHKAAAVVYCNAGDSGPIVGQVATITLSAALATTGESLNYGQIGEALSASATDCKGNAVSVKAFTYSSTSSFNENSSGGAIIADINPTTGSVCGGTWNRNSSGGVANYTTCTAPTSTPTTYMALVTAAADGDTSNAIAVYVHPVVTGVVLGGPTPGVLNGSCPANTSDPGTDCCPNDTVGTPVIAPVYTGAPSANFPLGCASQNQVGQLVARVYQNGNTDPANNITCEVGHLTFAPQSSSVVSIDENGAATADMPGSTAITATISNSSTATNVGFFSTCPPASISLTVPNQTVTNNAIDVAINTLQPLTATVLDTQGNPISGLTLEYNSTTPQTIPTAVGSVTPAFPGSADITAVCQPATCNPAPFSQIGLYGGGKSITSNAVTITAVGTSSTVLYMGSTSSQYVALHDFTTNEPSALIKLPYLPNSMVMNQAGTEIYLGSSEGLMTIATSSNTVGATVQTIPGTVLSVSPDGSTLVVTDPTRQTISLVATSSSTVTTSYGGVGTSASWSPDTQAVYITTATVAPSTGVLTPTGTVLTHSPYTDWQSNTAASTQAYTDAAIMVPSIGAFFAGSASTDGRSYCPTSTVGTTGTPPTVTNQFIPLADQSAAITDEIAATTNGLHILGATVHATPANLSDILLTLPINPATQPDGPGVCSTATGSISFTSTYTTYPLTGITPTAITGVFPSSNSAAAFVTYNVATGATTGGGVLPLYFPPTAGNGTLQFLTLGNGATTGSAPVSGIFSTDNFTFYAGTGSSDATPADNDVHLITLTYPTTGVPTATEATGSELTPNLPLFSGAAGSAPVNLLAQYPKRSTD